MLHLHHCLSARSFRPLWMLEELQLPYTLHMLPFPPRALARSFLELNPLGTVPLLVQGKAPNEVRMTESAAMCQYLAATHPEAGLDVAPTHPAYGAYLNWLHMSDATLTFPQTLVLRYGRFEPAQRQQPQVVQDYTRWFLARLRAVEAAVKPPGPAPPGAGQPVRAGRPGDLEGAASRPAWQGQTAPPVPGAAPAAAHTPPPHPPP